MSRARKRSEGSLSRRLAIPSPEKLDSPSPLATRSLVDQAHRAISYMILNHRLRSGEVIVEAPLAAELGISRTPLREALQRLEDEGLLTKRDSRNFMVRCVEIREYLQSLRLRMLIEPDATRNAAPVIPSERLEEIHSELVSLQAGTAHHTEAHWLSDDRLHGTILEYCGNEVTARIIQQLRSTTRLFEVEMLRSRLSHEHLAIVEALRAGDAERASEEMKRHLGGLINFVFTLFPS
ncbi:MAG: GntR family transcriptional regulator [Paracoccus sp. (in: a-proteobacteria)]|uniref:GntR family transcriptional regulator n=1 Tax=Paracoccus sp. TaxID=267 RepID=UPI0039E3FB80